MFRHKNFVSALLAASVIFSTSHAHGYIPQGRHLIQLMLERMDLPGTLDIRQRLVVTDARIDSQSPRIEQEVRIRLPEQYRSDIDTGQMHQFQVVTPGGAMTVIGNQIVSETQTWMDDYKELLIYRSRKRLAERLEQSGIRLSATGLGRFDGRICYIIGATHEHAQSPQVWISKDTFFPVRWISGAKGEGASATEIQYHNWQHTDGFWYPYQIEFYKNGEMIRKVEVLSIKKNIAFSDHLFDLLKLKQQYAPNAAVNAEKKDKSDIQKEIEDFKRMFE